MAIQRRLWNRSELKGSHFQNFSTDWFWSLCFPCTDVSKAILRFDWSTTYHPPNITIPKLSIEDGLGPLRFYRNLGWRTATHAEKGRIHLRVCFGPSHRHRVFATVHSNCWRGMNLEIALESVCTKFSKSVQCLVLKCSICYKLHITCLCH